MPRQSTDEFPAPIVSQLVLNLFAAMFRYLSVIIFETASPIPKLANISSNPQTAIVVQIHFFVAKREKELYHSVHRLKYIFSAQIH